MADAKVTLKTLAINSKTIVPYVPLNGKTTVKGTPEEINKKLDDYLKNDKGKGVFGHNFNLEGELTITKGSLVKNPLKSDWFKTNHLTDYYLEKCVDESGVGQLQWNESIEWYSTKDQGKTWKFEVKQDKDMYGFKPGSQTYRDWNARYVAAAYDQWKLGAEMKKANVGMGKTADEMKFVMDWLAKNGGTLKFAITDVPGMGQGGMGAGSGSGLETPKDCQGNTRRRVIHFNVGFPKAGKMCTATQILEAVDGKIMIMKLMSPALPPDVTKDEKMLENWRKDTDAMLKGQFPANAAMLTKV